MGQATIFAGSKIKTLKSTLNLNGGADIISSTVDPTSVATNGAPGSLLLNTTSGKLYRKNDSGSSTNWEIVGSGAGGINYVTNPDAESNTTGWSTYADAAGAAPVDGTGGTANITWTRSTTTPLRGIADFVLTKDAVNRQGQGVATDLTINLADQAKQLVISLNYEILSGTYADGDIGVYMIADPAGTPVVIQPAGFQMQSLGSGTKGRLVATFQTLATGQSYRLCFHVASTSAQAYSIAIDTVQVGPQNVTFSTPVTDWVSYTPTITASSGTLTNFSLVDTQWMRDGQNIYLRGKLLFNNASVGTWTNPRVSLPAGLTFATDTNEDASVVGFSRIFDSGVNSYGGEVLAGTLAYGNNVIQIGSLRGANGAGIVFSNSSPFTFSTSDGFTWLAGPMKIAGWSSSAQVVSDSSEGRVVAARVLRNAGQSVTSTAATKVAFDATTFDTTGSFDVANNRLIARVPGIYRVTTNLAYSSVTTALIQATIYRNGSATSASSYRLSSSGVEDTLIVSDTFRLNAGEFIEVFTISLDSSYTIVAGSYLGMELIQGSQTLLGGETVSARYMSGTSQAMASTAWTIVEMGTRDYDSHNAASGSGTGWRWTAPVSGRYQVSAIVTSVATTPGGATFRGWYLALIKNGDTGNPITLDVDGRITTTSGAYIASGSDTIRLLAGETVCVAVYHDILGSAVNTQAATGYNHMAIDRVGNY